MTVTATPSICLGVDPGSLACGWAVVSRSGSRLELLEAGVIRSPRGADFDQRILGMYPKKYVDRVVQKMEQEGVTFLLDHDVAEVKKAGEAYQLVFSDGETFETDYVLGATGREANVEGLGLDALGIACSSRGIKGDDHMRTSVSNIYASGDCVAKLLGRIARTRAVSPSKNS